MGEKPSYSILLLHFQKTIPEDRHSGNWRIHGQKGFEAMYEADYVGTHWPATYAVFMLTAKN